MYFGDVGHTVYTMFFTGLFGLLLAAPVYALVWILTRRRFPAKAGMHALRYLFLTYLICVGMLTLVPSGFDMQGGVNLVPFSSIAEAFLSTSEVALGLIFLNILMFVPMGIFLPWVFPKVDRLYKAVLISFGATLLIELLQVLLPGGRAFDVDDIILNTFGGAIGYSLFALGSMFAKKKKPLLREKIACIAALVLLPAVLFGFLAAENGREFKYGFSYTLMVPEEAEFTGREAYPETAMTYVRVLQPQEETLSALAETFSLSGTPEKEGDSFVLRTADAYLSVFPDYGWIYSMRSPTGLPNERPADEIAAEAEAFLRQHGLWADGLQAAEVNETLGVDPDGTERSSGKQVVYAADEADHTVTGWLSVFFDNSGIYEVSSSLYRYTPYREAKLASPGEALADVLKTHRCYVTAEFDAVTLHPQKAVLDTAELVYDWGMSSGRQNLPVWKLSGTFYGDGEQVRGTIMVPAILE